MKMTTYNSYEEAKIANPECDVYSSASGNQFQSNSDGFFFIKCKPEFHCMTVEKFLKDGHKFVEGDLFLNFEGEMVEVGKEYDDGVVITTHEVNRPLSSIDCKSYILRAAALNKPKRTKVEHVKVEFNHAWELFKLHSEGVKFYAFDNAPTVKRHCPIHDNLTSLLCASSSDLFRRIETEITERDEFIEAYAWAVADDKSNVEDIAGMLYDSGKFKLVDGE